MNEQIEGAINEETNEEIKEEVKVVYEIKIQVRDDASVGIELPSGENNLWVIRGILAQALSQACNTVLKVE